MKLKKASLLLMATIAAVIFYLTMPSLFAQTTSNQQLQVVNQVTRKEPVKAVALVATTQSGPRPLAQQVTAKPQVTEPSTVERTQIVTETKATTVPVTAPTVVTEASTLAQASQPTPVAALSQAEMMQIILTKAGIISQAGLTIIDDGLIGQTFQIEIRGTTTDPQILTLVGIYRYDSQTGTVSKQDYLTGEFQGL